MRRIGFDRLIDTDRPVAGTLPDDGRVRDADAIRIEWHPAVARPASDRAVWTRTPDTLWFDPPGVARYRCTPGTIAVTPVAGAAAADVDALLIATALPASLWLQGAVVLHAAAVVPAGADQALAIAGPSGSGKSHLAAALIAQGARLVADDSIAVEGGRCAGLAGGYHLGQPAADDRPFHRVSRSCRSAPLGTVIVLDDEAIPHRRLTGVDAVRALLASRHRASVPRLCGLEPRVLGDIARLARAVRVFRWSRGAADMLLDGAIRATIIEERQE